MSRHRGYTVAELLIVVLIVGVLTAIGVPRLHFALRDRSRNDVTAWKIVTDLRRARSLAILHGATNSQGFALNVQHEGTKTVYRLVDLSNSEVVDSHTLDSSIHCEGGSTFQFTSLGSLTDQSDTTLEVSAADRTYDINIVPATGTVTCVQQ